MRLTRLLLSSLEGLKPLCIDPNFSMYKRTLDHLQSWRFVLPGSVKQATYHVSLEDKETPFSPHWGSWKFLYENLPQLKYHNPSIEFTVKRHSEKDSMMELLSDNGEVEQLFTTGLKQTDIKELLETSIDSPQ